MTNDSTTSMSEINFVKIRREERKKDEKWIKSFLQNAPYGTIATAVSDQPFLVTRNFVYDDEKNAIYFHGAPSGRTIDNIRKNPRVCFSTTQMGRLLPANKACEFGVEYAGVVAFGQAHLVEDPQEVRRGLQMLLDKYFPKLKPVRDYQPIAGEAIKTTAVIRIDINSWSGKMRKEGKEIPGAFAYPEQTDPDRSVDRG